MLAKTLFFTATYFITSTALANDICYKVVNPQNILIAATIEETNFSESKAEQATEVKLRISKDQESETTFLEVKAKSKNLEFNTSAIQMAEENLAVGKQFYVECDGGTATIAEVNGSIRLYSTGLDGEVNSSEGCSSGTFTIAQYAVLSEVSCK